MTTYDEAITRCDIGVAGITSRDTKMTNKRASHFPECLVANVAYLFIGDKIYWWCLTMMLGKGIQGRVGFSKPSSIPMAQHGAISTYSSLR